MVDKLDEAESGYFDVIGVVAVVLKIFVGFNDQNFGYNRVKLLGDGPHQEEMQLIVDDLKTL